MKPDIKEKWVKALKSGRYKQTVGALKDEYGYCCLGVLCNIYIKETKKAKWKKKESTNFYNISFKDKNGNPDGEAGILPKDVCKWAGIESQRGKRFKRKVTDRYGHVFRAISVIDMNDNYCDFKTIAKVIGEVF